MALVIIKGKSYSPLDNLDFGQRDDEVPAPLQNGPVFLEDRLGVYPGEDDHIVGIFIIDRLRMHRCNTGTRAEQTLAERVIIDQDSGGSPGQVDKFGWSSQQTRHDRRWSSLIPRTPFLTTKRLQQF